MSSREDGPGDRAGADAGVEGEYQDRDDTDRLPPESVGDYTDTDVPPGQRGREEDEGEYDDRDVTGEQRHTGEQSSYTTTDPGH